MSQQSIDFYLRQRKETTKRKAGADVSQLFDSKRLRVSEHEHRDFVDNPSELNEILTPNGCQTTHKNAVLLSNKKDSFPSDRFVEGKIVKTKGKAVVKLSFGGANDHVTSNGNLSIESSSQIETKNLNGTYMPKQVKFIKKGALSPKKKIPAKNGDISSYLKKESVPMNIQLPEETNADVSNKVAAERKELSLGDIKKCISKSSRMNTLKSRIALLNKGFDKLDELSKVTNTSSDVSTLKGFKSIELLVPSSPVKQSPLKCLPSPLTSPMKDILMSPRKIGSSPIKSPIKVPAHERLASLTVPTPALTLPHHYRFVCEVFKGIEQVTSMLYNREENITFQKIKQAVQEMLRRNITEKYLRQIKYVSPQMYSFSMDKVRNFGTTAKKDEYELVLKPNVLNKAGSVSKVMTPAIILERQRNFYNLLLDKVKEHHAAFLRTLDPPLDIPNDKLKRWHPEFDLEHIPEVEEHSLPEAPNVEKFSTANDVLNHFREQFNCNTKMEKALERLAEAKARGLTPEEQAATGLKANGLEANDNAKPETVKSGESSYLINPALKGIPKSLLERVRAKQAAKALESMTRSPAREKDALMYQRLPDLARLVRNLFVTEKKSVLPFETVITKLDNSFRIKMSNIDLTTHVHLLSKELPDWLTFHEYRKIKFLKIIKDSDMSKILGKLRDLAIKHSN